MTLFCVPGRQRRVVGLICCQLCHDDTIRAMNDHWHTFFTWPAGHCWTFRASQSTHSTSCFRSLNLFRQCQLCRLIIFQLSLFCDVNIEPAKAVVVTNSILLCLVVDRVRYVQYTVLSHIRLTYLFCAPPILSWRVRKKSNSLDNKCQLWTYPNNIICEFVIVISLFLSTQSPNFL